MSTLPPTDAQIATSLDHLRGNIRSLKDAAYVLDTYVNSEFKSGYIKDHPCGFDYLLSSESFSGISFMLDQVRAMAASLEWAVEEAFEPSDKEQKA